MLTVWCMNTGNHAPDSEVDTLKRQVKRHLTVPHEFKCIRSSDLPGWWGKVRLFGPDISRKRNLWLDLDVCITGSLDALVEPLNSQLRICKNWAKSGHGGCQSSVMYWEGDSAQVINSAFDHAIAYWPPRNEPGILWGDQEWITQLRDQHRLQVEYFDEPLVKSYKYHLRDGLTDDCRVAVFHGKPDPGDVNDHWVKKCRA